MKTTKNSSVAVMGNTLTQLLRQDSSGVILLNILDETIAMVEYLYTEGYRSFLLSMGDGFGNIAAQVITFAKEHHHDICLIAVVNHQGEEVSYVDYERERYQEFLLNADLTIINTTSPCEEFFITHCSHLLCYFANEDDCSLIHQLNSTNIYDLL